MASKILCFQKTPKLHASLNYFWQPGIAQYFCFLVISSIRIWLVVSTPLKNISQIGNLPQIGVNKKGLKPPGRYPSITSWWLVQPTPSEKIYKSQIGFISQGLGVEKTTHIRVANTQIIIQSKNDLPLEIWEEDRKSTVLNLLLGYFRLTTKSPHSTKTDWTQRFTKKTLQTVSFALVAPT